MINTQDLPQVAPDYDLRELLEAGCHFGHSASDWHPNMAEWIYMQQDGIHIFDLEKTAQQLQHAYNYFYQLGKSGQSIIFVGTKRQAKEVVEEQAAAAGIHWITSRWMGGLLTNWEQVRLSIKKMLDIETGLAEGKFDMYTKFEQLQLEKDANRLARFFKGLRSLKKIPDALFIIDPRKELNAVKEALLMGVPVIGLVDTNSNPDDIDLVIPANDDGRGSIELIVTQLTQAYQRGVEERTGKKTVAPVKEEKAEEKTEQPAEKSAEKKAEKPAEKPVAKKAEKPAEKAKKPAQSQAAVVAEMSMTRDELNQLATKVGVENPTSLANKQAVVDAINQQQS